jgi:hypothetical protein
MFHPVKNPRHYAGDGKISCMDALESMMSKQVLTPTQAYWWGCAFKYLWRWHLKGGIRDLEKCKQCIDYLTDAADPERINKEEEPYVEREY